MTLPEPLLVDKPLGASPLDALHLLRERYPQYRDEKLAYAGRLDPMASGLLLALRSSQLTEQETYWGLPKEYEASVLLGLTTDSYDLLGLAAMGGEPPAENRILAAAAGLVGKHLLSVPTFSSPSVNGRPMFAWAREGIPHDVAPPVRRMRVSEIRVTGMANTNVEEAALLAADRISRVIGSFRQGDILRRWSELSDAYGQQPLVSVTLTVACGSGTYVRSLAHELGRRLRCGAALGTLRRVRVGPWSVDDPQVIRFA